MTQTETTSDDGDRVERSDGVETPHTDGDFPNDASVTDKVHDTSWSANLEQPRHGEDRERLVAAALDAVDHTAPGNHVNLVTHATHGHPESYLVDRLADHPAVDDWTYVAQCGCGGHVLRVAVEAETEAEAEIEAEAETETSAEVEP